MEEKSKRLKIHDFGISFLWSLAGTNFFNIIIYFNNINFISNQSIIILSSSLFILNIPLFLARKNNSSSFNQNSTFLLLYISIFTIVFMTQFYVIYSDRMLGKLVVGYRYSFFVLIFAVVSQIYLSFFISIYFKKIIRRINIRKGVLLKSIVFNLLISYVVLMVSGNILSVKKNHYWEENKIFGQEYYRGFPIYFKKADGIISSFFEYKILTDELDSMSVYTKMATHHSSLSPEKHSDELFIGLQYFFNINELYSRKFKEALTKLPPEFINENNIYKLYFQYSNDSRRYTRIYSHVLNKRHSLKNRIKIEDEIDSLLNAYQEYAPPIVYLQKSISNSTKKEQSKYQKTRPINKLQTDYYKNGNKKYEVYMIDGKLEGIYKIWYETGELESEIEYRNGMRDGKLLEYYKNGQLSSMMIYKNGTCLHEQTITYYENGQIRSEYKNGDYHFYKLKE